MCDEYASICVCGMCIHVCNAYVYVCILYVHVYMHEDVPLHVSICAHVCMHMQKYKAEMGS